MNRTLNMTQGKPLSLLFFFALPLMLGNVFQQLYTVIDTAIVGRGVGMEALAALGSVDWQNWMFVGLAQGFTQGFSIRMSQKFGEQNIPELKRFIGQSAVLSLVLAAIFTLAGHLCVPLFFRMLNVPADLAPTGEVYIRILMSAFPVTMFYNFCASVLRAVGDSKTPLIAMLVAAATNIVLDCIAVFLLHWDVPGVAAATIIAQVLAGAFCAVKIVRTPQLHFGKEHCVPDFRKWLDLLKVGAPLAAKSIVISLGGIAIQSVVNGFAVSFIAGITATNKLYGILEIAAISYGYAISTYVGQNYGARQLTRVRQGMRAAVVLSLITSALISIVMLLLGRSITMIFITGDDPIAVADAGQTAYTYLCFMAFALPMLYFIYIFQSALQGMGNAIIPMISGIVELFLRVGVAMLAVITACQELIYAAEISPWIGAGIFLSVSYLVYMRKRFPKRKTSPVQLDFQA